MPHVECRHDVEDGEAVDGLRVIERQPVGDPRAAIMAYDREAFMTEPSHQAIMSSAITRLE